MINLSSKHSFIPEAEDWADSVWSKIDATYCGNCEIREHDDYLSCELEVTLRDNSIGRFIREEKEKVLAIDVPLEEWQREELQHQGFFILKHYNG